MVEEGLEKGRLLISLKQDESAITLEPGGQVELSSGRHNNLSSMKEELEKHVSCMNKVGKKLSITWLDLGIHPGTYLEEVSWVPKPRSST